jgi:hypothetical protein
MLNLKGARAVRDSYAHGEDLGIPNYTAGGDIRMAKILNA